MKVLYNNIEALYNMLLMFIQVNEKVCDQTLYLDIPYLQDKMLK